MSVCERERAREKSTDIMLSAESSEAGTARHDAVPRERVFVCERERERARERERKNEREG